MVVSWDMLRILMRRSTWSHFPLSSERRSQFRNWTLRDHCLLPLTLLGRIKVDYTACIHIICNIIEPAHEIMVLFVLHKLILQKRSHPVRLDVWFLVGLFVYFHTLCEQTAKALARLRGCASSPEPSLVAYVISTIILWVSSIINLR